MLKNYDELIEKTKQLKTKPRIAVACAIDSHTLEAVLTAARDSLVTPILVGEKEGVLNALKETGHIYNVPETDIYFENTLEESCAKAVSLVKEGKADFLMKGKVDTSVFLRAVVNKECGLNVGKLMSHVGLFSIPNYKKLIADVDGGMIPYPTLEQKKQIIENTVDVFRKLGYEKPKVGVLACVEKINPKMPETVEADALKQMNISGEIKNCIVEGPISYDCAMNKEIADFKGFVSECAGDCDILVTPNIHAGNILGKVLLCSAGAKMAGIVVGAKCPVILSSRGASAEEKYLSIALAAVVASRE